MARPFRFKQFSVAHDKSAMKVGTDGVLLAAWCDISGAHSVLDIGCGSGVMALVMAQRNLSARITGLEIEENAVAQASENFKQSPWPDRLHSIHDSFQNYVLNAEHKYDHIVCNPPFFEDAHHSKPVGSERSIARNDSHLSLVDLISGSSKLLPEDGRMSLILPIQSYEGCLQVALENDFYLTRKTLVLPIHSKPAHRVLLEFSKQDSGLKEDELTIQKTQKRNDFTLAYIELVREFYTIL